MDYYHFSSKRALARSKKQFLTNIATRLCLNSTADMSNQSKLVKSLVSFLRQPDGEHHPQLVEWVLSYGTPALIQYLMNSAKSVDSENNILRVLQNVNPDWILPKEYICPDIQVAKMNARPRTVLVCFAGHALRLNIAVQLLHLLAASHFDMMIYLRDVRKQQFTQGLDEIADNLTDLNMFVRDQIPSDSYVSVLGTSGGGAAAIDFSETHRAQRLVLCSPSFEFKGVRALDSRTTLHGDNVRLFFAEYHPMDQELISQWRTTAYASSIQILNSATHATLKHMFDQDELCSMFEWMLAGDKNTHAENLHDGHDEHHCAL